MHASPAWSGPVGLPARERRLRWAAGIVVCLVAALLVLPPAGRQVLTSSDETRFVLLARDMLERGVWFDASVRDRQYRNKPPLYPWSIAAIARIRGSVDEFAAALPVALAAIGTVLATFLLGDRMFGWRAGAAAALVLTTTYAVFQHTLELLPDMLVVAFATLAGWAFWSAMVTPRGRGWMIVFYLALAFAVFSKGPMGLLPLAVAIAWLLASEGVAGLRRLWSPAGILGFALITAGWLAPFMMLGADSFGERVLWNNWLDWYLGMPGLRRFDTLVDLALGLTPWVIVVPLAFAQAWRSRSDPAVRFALLSTVVPLVLVLIGENIRRRYLLPVYPGAALVLAWWALAAARGVRAGARLTAWVALAAGLTAAAGVAWLGRDPDAFLPALSWAAAPLYVAVVLLGLCVFHALRTDQRRLLVGGVSLLTLVALGYGVWPYIHWVNSTQDFPGLASRVEQHARGGPVAVYGGRFFQLDFYLGRDLVRLRSVPEVQRYVARPDTPLVVVDGRAWRELQGQLPSTVEVVTTMHVRSWDMRLLRGGPPALAASEGAPATGRP
jgi:4-amino-4-deoxy-L-arabinose transferase-like glycosyltransferase